MLCSSQVGRAVLVLSLILAIPLHAQESTTSESTLASENRRELVAIVLSAGYCADSQQTDFRTSVERMKLMLKEQADSRDYDFAVVGVALDRSVEDGLAHLARLGKFDQVMVGGGWTNLASSRVLRLPPTGETTTPQVLVMERAVRRGRGAVEIRGERLLYRAIGVDEIVRWVSEGAPIR